MDADIVFFLPAILRTEAFDCGLTENNRLNSTTSACVRTNLILNIGRMYTHRYTDTVPLHFAASTRIRDKHIELATLTGKKRVEFASFGRANCALQSIKFQAIFGRE